MILIHLYSIWFLASRAMVILVMTLFWFSEYNHRDGSEWGTLLPWALFLIPLVGEGMVAHFIATRPDPQEPPQEI